MDAIAVQNNELDRHQVAGRSRGVSGPERTRRSLFRAVRGRAVGAGLTWGVGPIASDIFLLSSCSVFTASAIPIVPWSRFTKGTVKPAIAWPWTFRTGKL